MWHIEPTPASHLDEALTLIVTGGRQDLAPAQALRELRAYLASDAAAHATVWWAWQGEGAAPWPLAAAAVISSPGKTALVLHSTAAAGVVGIEPLADVLSAAARHTLATSAVMVQVLLEPSAQGDVRAFEQAGFVRLAELIYMRLSLRGRAEAGAPPDLQFVSYAAATHADFARAIAASYAGSLDCPAMEGVRDVQDAIAAHKVAGIFRPDLWTLALCDGQPAGILLLNENFQARALEVVYMGVAAPFRGRGVGRALLARAVQLAKGEHFSALCLAVDTGNTYACRLYVQSGFVETFRRLAYMRKK